MKILFLIAFGIAAVLGDKTRVYDEFAAGNVQFTSEIYKVLSRSNSGNFLVCPLSVQIILALAHAGAGGNTAKELATSICLPNDQNKIQGMIEKLAPYLQVNENYTLTSANKIYLANHYKLVDQFKRTSVNVFAAESENIDFGQSEQAALDINKWVEGKTYHKIKHLISSEDLHVLTAAVLVNAMYFSANWLHQFDPIRTRKSQFYVNNFQKVDVDMMSTRTYLNYYQHNDLNAQFVELPYEGDDITMTVVLPNDQEGLANLETRIAEVLVTPKFELEDVDISLPKFTMESEIPLIPVLQQLGVKDAFTFQANFSGMSALPVYINTVVQKTFIENYEKGTTAAASTAVVINTRTGPQHSLVADHPFIFFLTHRVSGVFFIGRFSNPENTILKTERPDQTRATTDCTNPAYFG